MHGPYYVSMLSVLFASLPLTHAVVPSTQSDYLILCFGNAPPATAGWPPGYPATSYTDSMELCSAVHGLSRNVGCQCTEPGGPVECSEATGGDPRLMRAISSVPPARPKTFEVFCQDRCICEDEDSSSAQEEFESEDSDELQFSNNDPLPPNVVVPGARTPLTAEQLWDRFSALGVGVGGPDRFNPRCNATCNVNSDCKPEYASRLTSEDCRCKVLSETVVPATHAVQYSAACQLSFANKRGEPVPCPCNTTYVSHACCESFEGRVWETPELKLGELKRTLEDL